MDFLTPDHDPMPQWRIKELAQGGVGGSQRKEILKTGNKSCPYSTMNDPSLDLRTYDDSAMSEHGKSSVVAVIGESDPIPVTTK